MRCPTCNEKLVVSESDFSVSCPGCEGADSGGAEQEASTEKTIFDNLYDSSEPVQQPLQDSALEEPSDDGGNDDGGNFENIDDVRLEPDPVDLTEFDRVPTPPKKTVVNRIPPAGAPGHPQQSTPQTPATGQQVSPPASPDPPVPQPGAPLQMASQPAPDADVELEDLSTAGLSPTHGLPPRHPDEDDVLERIEVEGLTTDEVDLDELYGIKCKICDTRIHVTEDDAGKTVECPMCYTEIKVSPPKKPVGKKEKSKGGAERARRLLGPDHVEDELKLEPLDDEELSLAPPVDVPPTDTAPVAENQADDGLADGTGDQADETGLPPVEQNLLKPLPPPAPVPRTGHPTSAPTRHQSAAAGIPELEVLTDGEDSEHHTHAQHGAAQQAAVPQQTAAPHAPSRREMFERSKYEAAADGVDEIADTAAPEVFDEAELGPKDLPEMFSRTFEVFKDIGIIWRISVAAVLIGLGGTFATYVYQTIESEETGFAHAAGLILYGLIYFCFAASGTAFLWYICGCVFRDTALGNVKVANWSSGGFDQIKSSWLLFSFSFFLVWLPFFWAWLFISAIIEMMLAPPLLLGAWFNQSPFNVFAPDAFRNFRRESSEWTNYYLVVLVFGCSTGAACAMMRMEFLNPVLSMAGGFVQAFMTVAFAAVTGGHIGRVVARLNKP